MKNLPDHEQLKIYHKQPSPSMSKESLQEEGNRTKEEMQEILMEK